MSGLVRLFSRSYIPILEETPHGVPSESYRMLLQMGAVRSCGAGVFTWLPVGQRVLDRITAVVAEEMDNAGFEKVTLPALQPQALYEESGRVQALGDELMRVRDRRDAWHILAPTAEEVVVDAVRRDVRGARQLPFGLWQCGPKWRDEARSRGGPLRGREFLMKDAYSFHADAACAARWYERTCSAYAATLGRLCPPGTWVQASGASGAMGGSLSHEWLVVSSEGEDSVTGCAACGHRNAELPSPAPPCAHCVTRAAVEVGHTFVLGTRYTVPMALTIAAAAPLHMGCYGIGVSRLVPVLLGVSPDRQWPSAVAPYCAVVVPSPRCAPDTAAARAKQIAAQWAAQHAPGQSAPPALLWDEAGRPHERRVARARLLRCGEPWQLRADGSVFRDPPPA